MISKLLFIIFSFFLVNNLSAQEKKVYVTGSIVLDNQSDHSGVKILFNRKIPTQKDTSIVTDSSGKFSMELIEGIYDITLSKKYYDSVIIKGENLFADKNLGQIDMHYLGEFLSGEIKGILKSGTYEVRYSLKVKPGDTLTIEPGTILKFHEGVKFIINGIFYGLGTKDRPIVCTSLNEIKYWSGMVFFNENYKKTTAFTDYFIIENSDKEGLHISGTIIDFNHLTYRNNKQSVFIDFVRHPSVIRNSLVINNKNQNISRVGGIYINASEVEIQNSIIAFNSVDYDENIPDLWENAGGICIGGALFDKSKIKNCLIYGNKANNGGGIKVCCDTKLINCVIANNIAYKNGSGIYYFGTDSASLVNCIISNNKLILNNEKEIDDYQITIPVSEYGGKMSIRNCLIYAKNGLYWNNPGSYFGKFVRTNFNGDSTDAYGNIFLEPKLADIENNDFTLLPGSPAIDAGLNIDLLPETDFLGNLRLWDGNDDKFAIVDMGAYEYLSPIKLFIHPVSSNDFENGYSGLEINDKDNDGNTFVQTNEKSHLGNNCLMLNNSNSTSEDWIVSDNINTQSGQKYFLSFWVTYSGEPFTAERDNLQISYSSNGENILNGNDVIFKVDKIEREWQKVLIELNTEESSNAKFAISANLQSNLKLFIDDIQLETQSIVSVNESFRNRSNNIVIFPNPAEDKVKFSFHSTMNSDIKISLTNCMGAVVREIILDAGNLQSEAELDVSDLPSGLYFATVRSGGQLQTEKFVVLR